jgi:hypothetical protein
MFKMASICDKSVRKKDSKIRYNKLSESSVKLHRNN